MPLIFQKVITRADLRANPSVYYVFGDNLERRGLGGQAAEMRGEPNAVGIPTKKSPHMGENAFFTDDDYRTAEDQIWPTYQFLQKHHDKGGIIVWPLDDIGTGRAQLQERAPKIWALIQQVKSHLE